MSYDDPVKTNFEDFGFREIDQVTDLLNAYKKGETSQYFKEYWQDDGIKPAFNSYSGYVFLTNSEYQAAMMNNGILDIFENCGECGNEGFPDEFDKKSKCQRCREIAKEYKKLEIEA